MTKEMKEALFEAASKGDVDSLHNLLLKIADKQKALLEQDNEGNTPLHLACRAGRVTIVQEIFDTLKGRAKFPWTHPDKLSPKESHEFVNQLLRARNNEGDTPFSCALEFGLESSVEVIETLLQNGDYLDDNSISDSTLKSLQELCRDKGLNLHYQLTKTEGWQRFIGIAYWLDETKKFPYASYLDNACKFFDNSKSSTVDLTNWLDDRISELGKGLNTRRALDKGRTALHYAVLNQKYRITEALLDKDADFEIMDDEGNTPFMLAKKSPCPITKGLFLLAQARKLHKDVIKKYITSDKIVKSDEMKELSEFINNMNSFVQSIKEEAIENEMMAAVLLEMGTFLCEPSETQDHVKNMKDLPKDFAYSDPIDADLAYQILKRIPKDSRYYARACELSYKLILNHIDFKNKDKLSLEDENIEGVRTRQLEETIKNLIGSRLSDEPLGNLALTYVIDDEHGMKGIPGFKSFKEPDSCMLFLQYMRTYSQGEKEHAKKQEQEKAVLKQENVDLKAEVERLKAAAQIQKLKP